MSSTEELEISLPGPVRPEVLVRLVEVLLSHLLFVRQQIPCTYAELKRSVQQDSLAPAGGKRKPRLSSTQKKAKALVELADRLLAALSSVFGTTEVKEVLLVLGNVLVVPKEIYHVRFASALDRSAAAAAPEAVERAVNERSRVIIRQLITSGPAAFNRDIPATRVFVLLLAPPTLVSDVFVPKPNLTPKPKKNTVSVSFCFRAKDGEPGSKRQRGESSSDLGGQEQPPLLWYQCAKPLKGFRLSQASEEGEAAFL